MVQLHKQPNAFDALREVLDETQRTIDQMEVKLHLMTMDARSAWEKLRPRLVELRQRAENATDATVEEVRKAADDLRAHARNVRDRLAH